MLLTIDKILGIIESDISKKQTVINSFVFLSGTSRNSNYVAKYRLFKVENVAIKSLQEKYEQNYAPIDDKLGILQERSTVKGTVMEAEIVDSTKYAQVIIKITLFNTLTDAFTSNIERTIYFDGNDWQSVNELV